MTSFAATTAPNPPVHVNGVYAGLGIGVLLLLALLWRATRRTHVIHVHAPAPAPAAPAPRRGSFRGKLLGIVVLVGAVFGGYEYLKPHGAVPATAAPSPSPTPSVPVPAPKIITHVVQAHPVLSGTQLVIVIGICAVMFLGLASLLGRRRIA